MPDLSPARLAEIEKRLNAAPRGQLSAVGTTIFKQNLIDDIEIAECYSKETAAFFRGTPDDIRDLLAEVRRLRAENERLTKERQFPMQSKVGLVREAFLARLETLENT